MFIPKRTRWLSSYEGWHKHESAPAGRSRAEGSVLPLPATRPALLSHMQAGVAAPACRVRRKSGRTLKPQKNSLSHNNLCSRPSSGRLDSETPAIRQRDKEAVIYPTATIPPTERRRSAIPSRFGAASERAPEGARRGDGAKRAGERASGRAGASGSERSEQYLAALLRG